MKVLLTAGSTSNILQIFIRDSSSTTGAGLTGLTNASSGLAGYYHKSTDTTATAISIITMTVGTFTSGGFKEIDATNMPGWYQFCIPDAVVASGASSAVHLKGATNMAALPIEIQLIAVNLQDAVAFGLSRIDNTISSRGTSTLTQTQVTGGAYALNTDGSGNIKVSSGTGANQISLASGQVTVATNNDKTGYALTQTFPTNFSSLAITGGGAVTAGTVSDKTGYSLTQTFPTNFSALAITAGGAVTAGTVGDKTGYTVSTVSDKTGYSLASSQTFNMTGNITGNLSGSVGSVTAGVTHDLTQAVPISNTANSVGDCLNAARVDGFGKITTTGSGLSLNVFAPDNTTIIKTFTLDVAGAPTSRT